MNTSAVTRIVHAALALALVLGLTAGMRTAAAADGLTLTLSQETGLGHFDEVTPAQRQPGQDIGASDDIIRVNDIVTYEFAAGMPEGATETVTNPYITFTLPRGEQVREPRRR